MNEQLVADFYKEKHEECKNLDSTRAMCQLVMALQALHLRSDDWKAQALWAAKSEWGDDTEIEFNKFECIVKNLKTGNKAVIPAMEEK